MYCLSTAFCLPQVPVAHSVDVCQAFLRVSARGQSAEWVRTGAPVLVSTSSLCHLSGALACSRATARWVSAWPGTRTTRRPRRAPSTTRSVGPSTRSASHRRSHHLATHLPHSLTPTLPPMLPDLVSRAAPARVLRLRPSARLPGGHPGAAQPVPHLRALQLLQEAEAELRRRGSWADESTLGW